MYVCKFLWNLHRNQEWTLNSDKSLQRLSGWQACLAWMCLVACTCVYSFMWLTRDRLNSTQKTAFKRWPRCGLSIEPFHFMNFFLRWRDHSCQKKKEEKNMDDISGGMYIPYSLRFVVRFQFFAVSWMNPTKEVFIRTDFVKTISLHLPPVWPIYLLVTDSVASKQ